MIMSIGDNRQWSQWLSRDNDDIKWCEWLSKEIAEGYDENDDTAGHNQTIHVQCLAQFQPTTNKTTVIIMIIIEIIILSSW